MTRRAHRTIWTILGFLIGCFAVGLHHVAQTTTLAQAGWMLVAAAFGAVFTLLSCIAVMAAPHVEEKHPDGQQPNP